MSSEGRTYNIVGKAIDIFEPWMGKTLDRTNGARPWNEFCRVVPMPHPLLNDAMRKVFGSPALEEGYHQFADLFLTSLFRLCKDGHAPERFYTPATREIDELVRGYINWKSHGHVRSAAAVDRLSASDNTKEALLLRMERSHRWSEEQQKADKDLHKFMKSLARLDLPDNQLQPYEIIYRKYRSVILPSFTWHYLALGLQEMLEAAKREHIRMKSMVCITKSLVEFKSPDESK